MLYVIMSDTHGRTSAIDRIFKGRPRPDGVIHLGDIEGDAPYLNAIAGCPVYLVPGNCDYFVREPREKILQLGKHRILLAHGHQYHVSSGLEGLKWAAREKGCDYAFFGHTHKPCLAETGDVTLVNPGSAALPRQADHKASYAQLEIDEAGDFHISFHYLQKSLDI